MYSIGEFKAFCSNFQVTPVKWRHFRVTSGHQRSHDISCCHATASYFEQHPSRKWNVQYTQVFGLQHPLLDDFRSNDVTSGSQLVILGDLSHFLSRDYLLLRATLCSKWNAQYMRLFALLQSLPGDFRSNDVTSGHQRSRDVFYWHVTASYCELYRLVESEMWSICEFSALYSHFQVTSGQKTSLTDHFRSS